MSRPTRTLLPGIAVAVVLALLATSAWNYGREHRWWGTSNDQLFLERDPMAATDLLGLTLVQHDESQPAGLIGKPRPVSVERWYAPQQSRSGDIARLGNLATTSGWTRSGDLSTPQAWVGAKPSPQGYPAALVIKSDNDVRHNGSPTIHVILAY